MDKNSWLPLFLKQFWMLWLILILTILRIIPFYYSIIGYLLFCLYHYLTSFTEVIYTKNSQMEDIIQKANLNHSNINQVSFFL